MAAKDAFLTITNQHIYDKLIAIETQVKLTNGQVKVNKWVSRTALTLVLMIIGALIKLV